MGGIKRTSTQCSISVGGFIVPAHVKVKRARKGFSAVPVTINGGLDTTMGSTRVAGGGSVAQATVNVRRIDDIGRLYRDSEQGSKARWG